MMRVRDMERRDLGAVQALHLASWRDAYAGLLPDDFLGDPVAQHMRDFWARPLTADDAGWVAETDGRLAGFAMVRCAYPDGPLLDNLHVDPAFRRRGVGTALMRAVAQGLRARGHDSLWLTVIAGNARARAAYRHWGGQESAPFEQHVNIHPVEVVAMRWTGLDPLLALGVPSAG